ncbi:hypothetical protein PSHT_04319 [Puccinia striiformis]|uniref:Uncharacterized protein n=2 Tax=Puccinia striiformis TaxID=27350 RepID=A0A0L0V5W4_9BASI|nr:hypothetical protein PSTG_12029 [Puccinia striiformis f. sp. tritici PST-78]POW19732.1 hypothetical protein PSHT_04319 [Puccinia striiformis]
MTNPKSHPPSGSGLTGCPIHSGFVSPNRPKSDETTHPPNSKLPDIPYPEIFRYHPPAHGSSAGPGSSAPGSFFMPHSGLAPSVLPARLSHMDRARHRQHSEFKKESVKEIDPKRVSPPDPHLGRLGTPLADVRASLGISMMTKQVSRGPTGPTDLGAANI